MVFNLSKQVYIYGSKKSIFKPNYTSVFFANLSIFVNQSVYIRSWRTDKKIKNIY
jgi:hypothetical protein